MEKLKNGAINALTVVLAIVWWVVGMVISVVVFLFVANLVVNVWQSFGEPADQPAAYTRGYTAQDREDFMNSCMAENAPESYCSCMYADITDNHTYEEFLNYYNAGVLFEIVEQYVDGCVEFSESVQWR